MFSFYFRTRYKIGIKNSIYKEFNYFIMLDILLSFYFINLTPKRKRVQNVLFVLYNTLIT